MKRCRKKVSMIWECRKIFIVNYSTEKVKILFFSTKRITEVEDEGVRVSLKEIDGEDQSTEDPHPHPSPLIEIKNDGTWREYILDLSKHPTWYGIIRRLRINPQWKGNTTYLGIDYIRFAPR